MIPMAHTSMGGDDLVSLPESTSGGIYLRVPA